MASQSSPITRRLACFVVLSLAGAGLASVALPPARSNARLETEGDGTLAPGGIQAKFLPTTVAEDPGSVRLQPLGDPQALELPRPTALAIDEATTSPSLSAPEPVVPPGETQYADDELHVSPAYGNTATRTITFVNDGPAGERPLGGFVSLGVYAGQSWTGNATLTVAINGSEVLRAEARYLGGPDPSSLVAPPNWSQPIAQQEGPYLELSTSGTLAEPVGNGNLGRPLVHLEAGENEVTITLEGAWASAGPSDEPWWEARVLLHGGFIPGAMLVRTKNTTCGETGLISAEASPGGGTFTYDILEGPEIISLGTIERRDDLPFTSDEDRTYTGLAPGTAKVRVTYTPPPEFGFDPFFEDVFLFVGAPIVGFNIQNGPPVPNDPNPGRLVCRQFPDGAIGCEIDVDSEFGWNLLFRGSDLPGTRWSVTALTPNAPPLLGLDGATTPSVIVHLERDRFVAVGVLRYQIRLEQLSCGVLQSVTREFVWGEAPPPPPGSPALWDLTGRPRGFGCLPGGRTVDYRITPEAPPGSTLTRVDTVDVTLADNADGIITSFQLIQPDIVRVNFAPRPAEGTATFHLDDKPEFPALGIDPNDVELTQGCGDYIVINREHPVTFVPLDTTLTFGATLVSNGPNGIRDTPPEDGLNLKGDDFSFNSSVPVIWELSAEARAAGLTVETQKETIGAVFAGGPGLFPAGLKATTLAGDGIPGGVTATIGLEVAPAGISITGPPIVGVQERATMTFSASPAGGVVNNWRGSDFAVANVDAGTGEILGVASGAVTVLVDYTFRSRTLTSEPFTIVVGAPIVQITGPTEALVGQSAQLIADALPLGGTLNNWRVTDSTVATIDPDTGLLMGVSPGAVSVFVDYTFNTVTSTSAPLLLVVRPAISVSFVEPSSGLAESDPQPLPVLLRVSTNPPGAVLDRNVSVDLTATGSAALGTDFTLSAASVSFSAGTADQATASLQLTAIDNTRIEGDKQAALAISMAAGSDILDIGSPSTHTVTIAEDDQATLSFVTATQAIIEPVDPPDGSPANPVEHMVSVLLTLPEGAQLATPISATLTKTTPGTDAGAADFTLTTPEITFSASDSSGTPKEGKLQILGDRLVEGNESILLRLDSLSPPGAAILQGTHQVTIVDNEFATIAFSAPLTSTTTEGSTETVNVKLTLREGVALDVPVGANVVKTGGDAEQVADWDFVAGSDMVTFPKTAQSGATATIGVAIVADNVPEASETIILGLTAPDPSTVLLSGSHTVTIAEGAPPGNIASFRISPSPGVVIPGTEQTFTATAFDANGTEIGTVSVNWAAPKGKKKGPSFEIVGSNTGSTVRLKATSAEGGILKNGLTASLVTASGKKLKATAELIVPWISLIEVSDPPVISSHIRRVEAKGKKIAGQFIVFPGRKKPASEGGLLENSVQVIAVIEPIQAQDVLLGLPVSFASFDVDDEATSQPLDRSDTAGAEDNRADTYNFKDAQGNKVEVKFKKRGSVTPASPQIQLNAQKNRLEASTELTTSLSPGDNYRVVASLLGSLPFGFIRARQKDWADQTEKKAKNKGRLEFVGSPTFPVKLPEFVPEGTKGMPTVRSSDVITIWRIVNVELDAMSAVTKQARIQAESFQTGGITLIEGLPGNPNALRVTIKGLNPGFSNKPLAEPIVQGVGAISEGFLDVTLGKKVEVIPHQDGRVNPQKPNEFVTVVLVKNAPKGFTKGAHDPPIPTDVRDDDDSTLLDSVDAEVKSWKRLMPEFKSGDKRTHKDAFDPNKNVFAEAFLVFSYASGLQRTGFVLSEPHESTEAELELAAIRAGGNWADAKNALDAARFVVYAEIGYQAVFEKDADVDSGSVSVVLGLTHGTVTSSVSGNNFGATVVYVEPMRDLLAFLERARPGTFKNLDAALQQHVGITAAHEVWHALVNSPDPAGPGDPPAQNPHSGTGIMGPEALIIAGVGTEAFVPADLVQLRNITKQYQEREAIPE